jgi:hypothetical protein
VPLRAETGAACLTAPFAHARNQVALNSSRRDAVRRMHGNRTSSVDSQRPGARCEGQEVGRSISTRPTGGVKLEPASLLSIPCASHVSVKAESKPHRRSTIAFLTVGTWGCSGIHPTGTRSVRHITAGRRRLKQ